MAKIPEKPTFSSDGLKTWLRQQTDQTSYHQVRPLAPRSEDDPSKISVLLPGSLNPLHAAHLKMADMAADRLQVAHCHFEISVSNVDKASVTIQQLLRRCDQAFGKHALVVSNAARFTEKSELFSGVTFAVGADTILRFNDLRYHHDSVQKFSEAIAKIRHNKCRFLVFGRLIANNFVVSQNIQLRDELRALCNFIHEVDFRCDVSSTQLRTAATRPKGKGKGNE